MSYEVSRLTLDRARDRERVEVAGREVHFTRVDAPVSVRVGSVDAPEFTVDRPGMICREAPIGALYLTSAVGVGAVEIVSGVGLDFRTGGPPVPPETATPLIIVTPSQTAANLSSTLLMGSGSMDAGGSNIADIQRSTHVHTQGGPGPGALWSMWNEVLPGEQGGHFHWRKPDRYRWFPAVTAWTGLDGGPVAPLVPGLSMRTRLALRVEVLEGDLLGGSLPYFGLGSYWDAVQSNWGAFEGIGFLANTAEGNWKAVMWSGYVGDLRTEHDTGIPIDRWNVLEIDMGATVDGLPFASWRINGRLVHEVVGPVSRPMRFRDARRCSPLVGCRVSNLQKVQVDMGLGTGWVTELVARG